MLPAHDMDHIPRGLAEDAAAALVETVAGRHPPALAAKGGAAGRVEGDQASVAGPVEGPVGAGQASVEDPPVEGPVGASGPVVPEPVRGPVHLEGPVEP